MQLFPYKSTWLADHEMGVFWNFLEVKFRENSKKNDNEFKQRTIHENPFQYA